MSKKFSISIILIILLLLGLWIWTLFIPKNSVSIGGSSSIDPIIQKLTNKYNKKNDKNFIYSSTGSQTGITNVDKGVYKMGFISKSTSNLDGYGEFDDIHNFIEYTNDYTFENYSNFVNDNPGKHYVTFAKDSLVFVYNASGLGFEPFMDEMNIQLTSNNQFNDDWKYIIENIYGVDNPNELLTWRELAQILADNSSDVSLQNYVDDVSNRTIIPYSTTPGSGTRSSFITATGVEPGQAVNIYPSNGAVFSQLDKSVGSFGYISMSYAKYLSSENSYKSNLSSINVDGLNPIELYENDNLEDYKLTREFNALFDSTKLSFNYSQEVLEFIWYMITNSDINELYHEEGLIRNTLPISTSENEVIYYE